MRSFQLPELPRQSGLRWSVCVRDASTGDVLAQADPEQVLRSASIGKIFLLLAAAELMEAGELSPEEPLAWHDDEMVGDSGLWHRLSQRTLPAVDVCALVGAVSDNLATNVLLRRVGPDAVARTTAALGCVDSALLDRVRNERGPTDPPTLSVGRADELSQVMVLLHRAATGGSSPVAPAPAGRVLGWLGADTDLSMVSSAFGLDPLGHDEFDRGFWLVNKTGTISTVRWDVGLVRTEDGRATSWAVGASWDDDADPRDEVLATMAGIGRAIRAHLS